VLDSVTGNDSGKCVLDAHGEQSVTILTCVYTTVRYVITGEIRQVTRGAGGSRLVGDDCLWASLSP